MDLVQRAQGSKAPIQRLADRISEIFVPAVLLVATGAFVIWFVFGPEPRFTLALTAFITTVIIACPCAMGLATPTAIMVGTGKGAEAGVLIRVAQALEGAHRVNTVILDKTGTLRGHELAAPAGRRRPAGACQPAAPRPAGLRPGRDLPADRRGIGLAVAGGVLAADRAVNSSLPTVVVTAGDGGISPADITVWAGEWTLLTFVNDSDSVREWMIDGIPNLDVVARPGQTASLRFVLDTPGRYMIMSGMAGEGEMAGTWSSRAAEAAEPAPRSRRTRRRDPGRPQRRDPRLTRPSIPAAAP